jgi:hypothetical protein
LVFLTDFPPVQRTGYPDQGLPAVDPCESSELEATVTFDEYNVISFQFSGNTLDGLSDANVTVSYSSYDDVTYDVTTSGSTDQVTFTGAFSLTGQLDGATVNTFGYLNVTYSGVERFGTYNFRFTGGRFVLVTGDKQDTPDVSGLQVTILGVPDSVTEFISRNQLVFGLELWNSIESVYEVDELNLLFTLVEDLQG